MKTDRELLELAARACGFKDAAWAAEQACISTLEQNKVSNLFQGVEFKSFWNPLTNDGDCARLEAELKIDVRWGSFFVQACTDTRGEIELFKDHNNDHQATRRKAIVTCAAEMQRMKEYVCVNADQLETI